MNKYHDVKVVVKSVIVNTVVIHAVTLCSAFILAIKMIYLLTLTNLTNLFLVPMGYRSGSPTAIQVGNPALCGSRPLLTP